MSDPQRSHSDWDTPGATRDARIERLLLSGLDHYFQGRYEYAINVWTRVAFLERGHSRATAYIARARTALAERQRESEELVHAGVEAYNAGRLETARDLLTAALDRGGPNETAQLYLERLTRVVPASTAIPVADRVPADGSSERPWLGTLIASGLAVAAVLTATMSTVSWFVAGRDVPAEPRTQDAALEALPVSRTTEVVLARARDLVERGRVREALAALDAISAGDASAADADRLRTDLQRRLLSGDAGAEGERR